MRSKKIITISLAVIIIFSTLSITSFAHSGRTDSSGGHWDHSTGTYHYHNGGGSSGGGSNSIYDGDHDYGSFTPPAVDDKPSYKPRTQRASLKVGDMTQLTYGDRIYYGNWTTEDTDIISLSEDGIVTALSVGEASVYFTLGGEIIEVMIYQVVGAAKTKPQETNSNTIKWETIEGQSFCYKSGKKLTEFQHIEGDTYFFDSNGIMQKRWVKINDDTYYFKDGKMLSGSYQISDISYVFDNGGKLISGTPPTINNVYTLPKKEIAPSISDPLSFLQGTWNSNCSYMKISGVSSRFVLVAFEIPPDSEYKDAGTFYISNDKTLYSTWAGTYSVSINSDDSFTLTPLDKDSGYYSGRYYKM